MFGSVQRLVTAASGPQAERSCTPAAVRAQTASIALAAATAGRSNGGVRLAVPAGAYCEQLYVVRPGDTIWSIAQRYAGTGDPRRVADELQAQVGGTVIQPGQELAVP